LIELDSSKFSLCKFGVLTKNNQNFSNYQTNNHTHNTILYLVAAHRKHGIVVENPNECPFCGGVPIKKHPYSDRIKKVGGGGGISEGSVQGNVELEPNPQKEEYYLCNGCNQRYVLASIDINLILSHIDGKENIAKLIKYYYPDGVTLTDLITKYRTGIVRKHSDKASWLSNAVVKRHLYVCFNYNGKRTYGIFIRKEKTKYYYTLKTMGVPKL